MNQFMRRLTLHEQRWRWRPWEHSAGPDSN